MKMHSEIFLEICQQVSKMSKCCSTKVGSLIVKDSRIISMGYNGTPSGYINCEDYFKDKILLLKALSEKDFKEAHKWFSERYEIHAEQNAIVWAGRKGISIEGSIIYCTLEPCFNCTKMILNSGIEKIIYSKEYERFSEEERNQLKEFCKECNITRIKI